MSSYAFAGILLLCGTLILLLVYILLPSILGYIDAHKNKGNKKKRG